MAHLEVFVCAIGPGVSRRYSADGKLNGGATVDRFDENGNVLDSKTYKDSELKILWYSFSYEYISFDDVGNWIKRRRTDNDKGIEVEGD